MKKIVELRSILDDFEHLMARADRAGLNLRAIMMDEPKQSSTKRASDKKSVQEVVMRLIVAHAASRKLTKTDLRRHALHQRLSPCQVGQALWRLNRQEKITVDGDLITIS